MRPDGFAMHCIHARGRRPALQPCGETFDGSGVAEGQHFDAAIGEIARMAAYPERQRLRTRVSAERDALHAAADQEARSSHALIVILPMVPLRPLRR